ncbi:MAG: glycosyltransferase N-terminal domain-containing protein, partial [Candidatus Omnitrophica bacterium]|nr:glycosyltransferase N-terminal domain-containing protein [Candidatus Omnitrophota bacterium]
MKKRIPGLSFRIVLDLAYVIALPFTLIFYVFKRKYHSGWLERLCLKRWAQVIQEDSPLVWIHAVSLGEARLAVSLYKQLKAKTSSYKYLLTSITSTGEGYLRNNVDNGDYVAYFPLDFSFVIRKIFSSLNLKSILIIETELWPNFIALAKSRNIPLGLINARISDKSYPRYKFCRYLVKNMLDMFSFVSLSGDIAEQRLKKLGYSGRRTIYKGSLKFSLSQPEIKEDARIQNFNAFLKQNNHKLFMAGSTHE